MDKITQMLENVVWCNYVEAVVHIENQIKNSYQYGLEIGRPKHWTMLIVIRVLMWDKRKFQINEYSDPSSPSSFSDNML